MAREIRLITASEDVQVLVDRGAKVNTDMNNLTSEDKGIKTKLADAVKGQFEEDETSVRLDGNTARAMVTSATKMTLNVSAERFPEVKDGVESGLLSDVVERKRSLVISPDAVEKAVKALGDAGIRATMTETFTVKGDEFRKMKDRESASVEATKVRKALEECVESEVSYRIKYETK